MLTADPDLLARIGALELAARHIVDGLLAGSHRSPQHGFSVEFAQHRDYVPGDDIRHIDWKVFGRTERFFLKQYELETDLALWLLVDASESMRYTSGGRTKYECACLAAAALAHLALKQSDSVGLATFDAQIRALLRPGSRPGHGRDLLRILAEGPGNGTSRIEPVLHAAAERFNRRGIVAIFSDLFDDPVEVLAGLRHLKFLRHDVIVFHVLDPAEIEFPFREATLFRGLETGNDMLTDPLSVRESYMEELQQFLAMLEQGCRDSHIDYVRLLTDADLAAVLAQYLGRRTTVGG